MYWFLKSTSLSDWPKNRIFPFVLLDNGGIEDPLDKLLDRLLALLEMLIRLQLLKLLEEAIFAE